MIHQTRTLQVDPKDAIPIWKQIEDGVRRLVASGALRPGGSVPSVRDLARDLSVNPATVAKAYQRLSDAGVLSVKRGEGTFVADAPPALAKNEKAKTLSEAALRYASVAVTLGAEQKEALDSVRDALASLNGGRK
ncbi:MAG TPA: GntR family transcriptional regulator [Thermoanaerobaculia bacterium]|nr:GntR family transcriptional regulator [Thermoanaerobaculia bacterium]